MNKLKFQIITFIQKFRGRISILLTAALVLLIFLEFFVIKQAISTVRNIAQANPEIKPSQLVRINFAAYDKVVNRIENSPDFTSGINLRGDPFGISAVKK